MNTDAILATLNKHQVDYILIGGMNYLIRHKPVLTFDMDVWVRNTAANLVLLNRALRDLKAQWGPDDEQWGPVRDDPQWLASQSVFCLTTEHGPLDIFREVRGLEAQYDRCRQDAAAAKTANGTSFLSLSDRDMLACQLALPEGERKLDRTIHLQAILHSNPIA